MWLCTIKLDCVDYLYFVLLRWCQSRNARERVYLSPSPEGVLKWNINGFTSGKLGNAGISGILQDENRRVLCVFSSYIRVKDSNEAKFIAIIFALEILYMLVKKFKGKKTSLIEPEYLTQRNVLVWVRNREECL